MLADRPQAVEPDGGKSNHVRSVALVRSTLAFIVTSRTTTHRSMDATRAEIFLISNRGRDGTGTVGRSADYVIVCGFPLIPGSGRYVG